MNKKWIFMSVAFAFYGNNSFSGAVYEEKTPWTGFYVGVNGGYVWSANNTIKNTGKAIFAQTSNLPDSRSLADSLATVSANTFFASSNGVIGGAQIGYNSLISNNLVIGFETDLDATGQSKSTIQYQSSLSIPALGVYNANTTVHKKLNYLGHLKGRFGVLISPIFLAYGSAGYAYGGAYLKTTYAINATDPTLSSINAQNSKNTILSGWSVGGGGEWFCSPIWSFKAEYVYSYLGPINNQAFLNQFLINDAVSPTASAHVNTLAHYSINAVKVGVNYHFS